MLKREKAEYQRIIDNLLALTEKLEAEITKLKAEIERLRGKELDNAATET